MLIDIDTSSKEEQIRVLRMLFCFLTWTEVFEAAGSMWPMLSYSVS